MKTLSLTDEEANTLKIIFSNIGCMSCADEVMEGVFDNVSEADVENDIDPYGTLSNKVDEL